MQVHIYSTNIEKYRRKSYHLPSTYIHTPQRIHMHAHISKLQDVEQQDRHIDRHIDTFTHR